MAGFVFPGPKMTSEWCKTANLLWDPTERDWADLVSPFGVLLLLS